MSLAKAGDVRAEEMTDAKLILRRRCPPGAPRLDRSLEVERGTGWRARCAMHTGPAAWAYPPLRVSLTIADGAVDLTIGFIR